jgi:hypothetical protein
MLLPTREDYIHVLHHLIREFEKQQPTTPRRGRRLSYSQFLLLRFFLLMHFKQIVSFKAQQRWLLRQPAQAQALGFSRVPHRTTLMRRYRQLHQWLTPLLNFVAQWGAHCPAPEAASAPFADSHPIFEDKSLFKARGPVWHQKDRLLGHIPKGLKHLDTQADWGKSRYHGWVYGYALHLSVDAHGFPLLASVQRASVSESKVMEEKAQALWQLCPTEIVGDDAYTNLKRTKQWAKHGVACVAPGLRLGDKNQGGAYKRWVNQEPNRALLKARNRIEPLFDLLSKIGGISGKQKPLPVQGLDKVRTFLLLCVLLMQLTMILNRIWGLAPRNISQMRAVWT